MSFEKLIKNKKIHDKLINSIKNYIHEYVIENELEMMENQFVNNKINEILKVLSNNKSLLEKLLKEEINTDDLIKMKPNEFNPDKYIEIIKKKEITEFKKENKATTDIFKCKKCKKSKSIVTQKQIRAGDEPATTFVECQECGHVFSF